MLLNQTEIAIRERGKREAFDLALHVGRRHFLPLAAATVLGATPFAAFNYWALSGLPLAGDGHSAKQGAYATYQILLVFLEVPLATAPVALYLGQILFRARPTWRQLGNDLRRAAPQLLWYQGVIRGAFVGMAAIALADWRDFGFAHFVLWSVAVLAVCMRSVRPYLGEVILLEKNPRTAARTGQMTTARRNAALHAGFGGDTLAQMIAAALAGSIGVGSAWLLLRWVRDIFFNVPDADRAALVFLFPIAVWSVAGFLAIVRFLGYLDLRIRREGWEVELRTRAEAAALVRRAI